MEVEEIQCNQNSNSFENKDCSTEPSSASPNKFKMDDTDEDIFLIDDDFLLFDSNEILNMEILENGAFIID